MVAQGRSAARVWAGEEGAVLTVKGDPKFGGETVHYPSVEALTSAFEQKKVHPGDLKNAVTEALIAILGPAREALEKDGEFAKVELLAYPPPVKAVKPVKGGSKKLSPEQEIKKKEKEQAKGLGETKAMSEALN